MEFSNLPIEVYQSIASNLIAKDILSLVCVNRRLYLGLGKSKSFWESLLVREASDVVPKDVCADTTSAKQAFLVETYKNSLSSVRWFPLRFPNDTRISDREGHLACVWHRSDLQRRIVITGGFSDDKRVYIINIGSPWSFSENDIWSTTRLMPSKDADFVYGASLTPLGESTDKKVFKALRFGGFRAGGYSHETNQIAILTIKEDEAGRLSADWEDQETHNSQCAIPRAYHTATLIGGRYLVVVGGMTSQGSVLHEAILDVETWTWMEGPISIGNVRPSGRHGHSVVVDSRRNRLMLFGGASGTDLLRSGGDYSEVWELQLGDRWNDSLVESLPWKWKKVYDSEDSTGIQASNRLSPSETLCLGRCHTNAKISSDKVLLAFGSGNPSTNGVLVFELENNRFVRPTVKGTIPKPRFTGVAVFLEEGYLLTHGGYCTQESDAIADLDILDLAPGAQRTFDKLPVDSRRQCHRRIDVTQAEADRIHHRAHLASVQWIYAPYVGILSNNLGDTSGDAEDSDSD